MTRAGGATMPDRRKPRGRKRKFAHQILQRSKRRRRARHHASAASEAGEHGLQPAEESAIAPGEGPPHCGGDVSPRFGGEEVVAKGTSDPGLTEADGTGVVAEPPLDGCGTPLGGCETPLGGCETPLLGGLPDLADGMNSPMQERMYGHGGDAGLGSGEIQAPRSPGLGCGQGPTPPSSPGLGCPPTSPSLGPAPPILGLDCPPAPPGPGGPGPGLGCGQGPTPPCSPSTHLDAVAAADHPIAPGSAPATPVQAQAAPGIPSSPAIVASPDRFPLPAPAVVAPPMSPSRSAPPLAEDVAERLVPPAVAPPLQPPAVAPPLPYRRHRAGISGVQFAASGNSKCRACDSKIAFKSARFEYWWMKNRPPGYVHPECVVRLAEDALELCRDLNFLRPADEDLMAAVSAAKEALQGRREHPFPA